jgi:hypothetical protein
MTQKTHKRIYAVLNALVIVGTFEGLLAVLNLNQPELYFKTAFYAGWFFVLQVALLYDLHHKDRVSFKASLRAFKQRFGHLLDKKFIKQWLHYLILPGLIYWGSLCVMFVNFGFPRIQQAVVVFSSIAFFINYLYLKEIFSRGREEVDRDIFIILSVVKIYASVLVYGASLAMVRNYCLNEFYFVFGVLALTFLLIYQALFQHRLINMKNLGLTFSISLAMGTISYFIIVFWNFNYFTAAVFLTACYNLFWGTFHYHLDKSLTWKAFWEILVISLVVAAMLFGATNFRAKIFNGCDYRLEI